MSRLTRRARIALGVTALAAGIVPVAGASATPTEPGSSTEGTARARVCADVPLGQARCHAIATTHRVATTSFDPFGSSYLDALELQDAYGQSSSSGAVATGPTVAIVDAYFAPAAASHLVEYRKAMGLPVCSDDTVTTCDILTVQSYGSATNTGWAQETDLDLQMVSAICPECKILLVSSSSNSYSAIFTAVNYAKAQTGVAAVSNSYGSGEFSGETSGAYASTYTSSSVVFTVSSGDSGYGAAYPSSLATVISVGGTSLSKDSNGDWQESAWSGAGSGCSSYVTKPSWQAALGTCTSKRRTADISAVGNPSTGVLVYSSGSGGTGWYAFGGTSVGAPIIAATYAHNQDAGKPTSASALYTAGQATNTTLYNLTTGLYDVKSGSNGRCTKGRNASATNLPLCTAVTGWDGPTGWGTPRNGVIPR